MPTVERKGKTPKYIEFPTELAVRLQTFADGRGESFTFHVLEAVRRHLDYPPPPRPSPPPLPDSPAKKKGGRK